MATVTSPWGRKASNSEGGDFELPKPGAYPAVLIGLLDLGTHKRSYNGKESENQKLYFVWELTGEFNSKGESFVVAQDYTWSLHKKANLRPMLEAWLGRAFRDDEEYEVIDRLGKPCVLTLTEGTSGSGKKFIEVANVAPPMKGLVVPEPSRNFFAFTTADLQSTKQDIEIPDWVPPIYGRNIVDEIKASAEFRNLSPF